MSELDTILQGLEAPKPRNWDLKLERMRALLADIGNPQEQLPPIVHIAGTNGKGSTLAFLRAMLEAGGMRVHVYTSPHLVRFNERIVLAGQEADDNTLVDAFRELADPIERYSASYFEAGTAVAFHLFSKHQADIVLLETGLGGRLDATNLVSRPALTAITPVSLDHQAYLGHTLAEIAAEKAGILKTGVPCVVARQEPEALTAIEARAKEVGAPLFRYGKEWQINEHSYHSPNRTLALPTLPLPGAHQYENAATALACLEHLPAADALTEASILTGLRSARWPARLQQITSGPVRELSPPRSTLWLDGGHNPAAGEALASTLQHWLQGGHPITAICAMLDDKDAEGYLRPLAPFLSSLIAIPIEGHESACIPPEKLAGIASKLGINASTSAGIEEALTHRQWTKPPFSDSPHHILICGSLYLAGNILAKQ